MALIHVSRAWTDPLVEPKQWKSVMEYEEPV
jgi:hypothetical protein